jgi:hypothetical protein
MTRVFLALVVGAAVLMIGAGLLLPSPSLLAAGIALMLGLGFGMAMRRKSAERRSHPETSEQTPFTRNCLTLR